LKSVSKIDAELQKALRRPRLGGSERVIDHKT
jgi:hypothetical protein